MATNNNHRVPVWDWPTRVFHWALVVLVIFAWYCAKIANDALDWPMWAGYGILGLLLFRIVWGFIGGEHARFASFVRGPGAALRYLREQTSHLGHNPLGAFSVIAMILALCVQVGTGLFLHDEDLGVQGPLYRYASSAFAEWAGRIHVYNINVIYALVGLHLAAIIFYLVRGENLVKPMITGLKDWHAPGASDRARGSSIAAILLAIVVAVIVYFVVRKPPA